jgi:hypothetical protein
MYSRMHMAPWDNRLSVLWIHSPADKNGG